MTAPPTIPEVDAIPVESFDEEPTPRDVPRLAQGSGNERPVTGRVERYSLDDVRESMRADGHLDAQGWEWAKRMDAKLDDFAGTVANLTEWRHGLTGHADGNGRIGTLVRRVEACEAYIDGERKRRNKLLAVLFSAASIAGGGAYTMVKASKESSAEAARIKLRLDHLERDVYPRKEPDR
jgi:hypothetical protein